MTALRKSIPESNMVALPTLTTHKVFHRGIFGKVFLLPLGYEAKWRTLGLAGMAYSPPTTFKRTVIGNELFLQVKANSLQELDAAWSRAVDSLALAYPEAVALAVSNPCLTAHYISPSPPINLSSVLAGPG